MKNVYKYFEGEILHAIKNINHAYVNEIQEIRLNVGQAIGIKTISDIYFLSDSGKLLLCGNNINLRVTANDLTQIFSAMCEYSVQSYKSEIVQGFVTLSGGHRVGICGTFVCEQDKVCNIVNITGLTIRIARQINGVANKIIHTCFCDKLSSVLVIGAPNTGKTTIIRDIVRQLGSRYKISVIDERGEISATNGFNKGYDLGLLTHVYNLCPKAVGINMSVKTTSPDIIVCDEIGADDDINEIIASLNTGVKFVCSAHAESVEQLIKRPMLYKLICAGVFDSVVVLSNKNKPCEIVKIQSLDEMKFIKKEGSVVL